MPADSKLATQLKQTAPGLSPQWDRIEAAVEVLANAFGGSVFPIPPFDEQDFTYVGGGSANDDNVATLVYKKSTVTVATLTFTYWGSTNNVKKIVLS